MWRNFDGVATNFAMMRVVQVADFGQDKVCYVQHVKEGKRGVQVVNSTLRCHPDVLRKVNGPSNKVIPKYSYDLFHTTPWAPSSSSCRSRQQRGPWHMGRR